MKILFIKKIQLPVFFISHFFYQLLHKQISFLQHFSTSFNTIWKKFLSRIFHFKQVHPSPPNVLHGQELPSMTKVCFLLYLLFGCLANPMLITAFSLFWSEGRQKPLERRFLSMLTFLGGVVHSTSWKCSLYFFYIFRMGRNFLIRFCSSDPSFNRNILKFLYSKFKTFAHAHIEIANYCVLFTNLLTWY